MNVLCLEQGEWMDPAKFPGMKKDWELHQLGDFALSPNAVAEFLQRLDESQYFKEPSLKEMKETKVAHSFNLTVGFTYTPGKETVEEEATAKAKGKGKGKGKSKGRAKPAAGGAAE